MRMNPEVFISPIDHTLRVIYLGCQLFGIGFIGRILIQLMDSASRNPFLHRASACWILLWCTKDSNPPAGQPLGYKPDKKGPF
jgi:hypothetical protein